MKYLITFALLYFAYRYFFSAPTAIEDRDQPDDSPQIRYKERGQAKDDEYVDYEEVE
jgi:hypothetical protein